MFRLILVAAMFSMSGPAEHVKIDEFNSRLDLCVSGCVSVPIIYVKQIHEKEGQWMVDPLKATPRQVRAWENMVKEFSK